MRENLAKIKIINEIPHIFDPVRRKYLVLTPEEKVRQGFIHYLISQLGYSRNHFRTEMSLKYNTLNMRSDILVFDRSNQPYLLVECKAENVPLTKEVLEQASRYNTTIQAPYLCVTNGIKTYCFSVDFEKGQTKQLKAVPLPKI